MGTIYELIIHTTLHFFNLRINFPVWKKLFAKSLCYNTEIFGINLWLSLNSLKVRLRINFGYKKYVKAEVPMQKFTNLCSRKFLVITIYCLLRLFYVLFRTLTTKLAFYRRRVWGSFTETVISKMIRKSTTIDHHILPIIYQQSKMTALWTGLQLRFGLLRT